MEKRHRESKERIGVLLTSCGGLSIPGIVECFHVEKEYDFHIVGVDVRPQAIGAHFTDSFYTVPDGDDPEYSDRILRIAQKEDIDVVVPLSDEEVLRLCRQKEKFANEGIALICSDAAATETSSDKGSMLAFLKRVKIPVPDFYCPTSLVEMDNALEMLGYPEKEVVLKPRKARGARGFWILSERQNGQDLILKERCLQKLPYHTIRPLLNERSTFPPVVVMQYLRGPDFNVDVVARQGNTLYCIPIQRIAPNAGPVQVGRIAHDDLINDMVNKIVAAFGFDYNINVELAYPEDAINEIPLVYEINPRVSAPIAAHRAAGINLLLLGVLLALGRQIPKDLSYREITMQRCWQEIYSTTGEF